MFVIVYLAGAALLAIAPHVGGLPEGLLYGATIAAWVGTIVAVIGDCVQLFGIATVRMTPLPILRLSVEEEEREQRAVHWWWTPVFAALLILWQINVLSIVALAAALLRCPVSAWYLHMAKTRLEAESNSTRAGTR